MFSKSQALKFENQIESPESQKSESYLYISLDPQLVDIIGCVITRRLKDTESGKIDVSFLLSEI